MAKKKESLIALESDRFAKKVKEFQDYLEDNPITNTKFTIDDKVRQNEIQTQIKLMQALGVMLQDLKNMREQDAKNIELRGDVSMNSQMRKRYGNIIEED